MTDLPPTPEQVAADLINFYKGATIVPNTAAAAPGVTQSGTVRGGVYTPEEAAAAGAAMNITIEPGSWRDFEMRGIPTIQWPEHVMAAFIADQSKPQPPIWSDPRMAAAAIQPTAAVSPVAPNQTSEQVSITSADIPTIMQEPDYSAVINAMSAEIHQGNVTAGWWNDIKTGTTLLGKDEYGRDRRNVCELLCLVHSEISEAMEGYRKNLMDDKLPHRSMFEVELADTLIRIFDIAGAHNLDLGGAIAEKRAFNAKREDHKLENRLTDNGKKF